MRAVSAAVIFALLGCASLPAAPLPTDAQFPPERRPETKSPTLRPFLGYDFLGGSDGYRSHAGTAGASLRFKEKLRLSGSYTALSDSDYSLLHTGVVRVKKEAVPDLDLSGALILSGGRLKESEERTSSFAFDFSGTRYLDRGLDAAFGYRYTEESVSFKTSQQVNVVRRRQIETVIVEGEESSRTVLHTLRVSAGRESLDLLPGLYGSLRLSSTFSPGRASSFSEGLELSRQFPYAIEAGLSYSFTQSARSEAKSYFGLFLSKSF